MSPRTPPSSLAAAGTDSIKQSKASQLGAGVTGHSKPCTACRRRKVRCCKTQPGCANCSRHGLVCIYDSGDGASASVIAYGADQAALYDRIDRLERLIEEMSTSYLAMQSNFPMQPHLYPYAHIRERHASSPSQRRTPDRSSPDWSIDSYATEDQNILRSEREDHGTQVFEPHVGYYMSSTFWMNLHEFTSEPRCLLDVPSEPKIQPAVWPFAAASSVVAGGLASEGMSRMHLPLDKENFLLDYFWKNVHPFVNINHRQAFRDQLQDFRRGASPIRKEFEATMLCQQLLGAAAMSEDQAQQTLAQSKGELVSQLRLAAETALSRADILRTRKFIGFQALVYYICYLFGEGQAEQAIALTGLAGRVGMRLGLHRDPGNYNIAPWVAEMRRRLWNTLLILDSQMFNGEGAESALEPLSNVQRSMNAEDCEWIVSRFAKPHSTPVDREGWTEQSHSILWSEMVRLTRRLGRMSLAMVPPEEMYRLIDETATYLTGRFVGCVDESNHMQVITLSRFRAEIAHQRLSIGLNSLQLSRTPSTADQGPLFLQAIDVLEETSRGEAVAVAHGLGWLYKWPVPWNALAFVLTGLARIPQSHPNADRAWEQVELAFRRHDNPDVAAWRAIEQLCDQAMYYHPHRMHAGYTYATRAAPAARASPAMSSKCSGAPAREGVSRGGSLSPAPRVASAGGTRSPAVTAAASSTARLFGDMQLLPPDMGGEVSGTSFGSYGQGYVGVDIGSQGGSMVGIDDPMNHLLYSDWNADPRRLSGGF
ncbi:hypothetical protein GGTG_10609 [Gaeumannomyces tritici R3-111a-1]|uniref:Zn(2)-C6 fungal-type domain-containing protein n=1 Tax=Gaeumannomyces tritici (strain R3-111a-1) TaxID=644352 RepID=J3PAT4_GAET3|nr:hypothetical protein GGTG_10609 [Gaeumannomyces tritici R3-111a-1]EJT71350.1 hypothetical protein GGTG_10609 [Gaeumannomyces tritici R3-111a-1]